MDLILIRHADAGDPGPEWPDDDQRPLTKLGEAQSVSMGQALGKLHPGVALLCSSPLLRARQTAALVSESSGWADPGIHHISPQDRLDEVVRGFETYEVNSLAYVGHEPTLSMLITWLLTRGDTHAIVEMKKGACALLKTGRGSAVLSWLIVPNPL
ncbi:MAG TPA: phosphoglycerate mutase family protein [Actinomycetota bacterium]|nr:phosphoglycerate mutase family protein [Actinomycetota bacterium]